MKILSYILVLIAFFILVVGLLESTSSIQESAAAGIACFFGIMARLAQASAHHSELLKK